MTITGFFYFGNEGGFVPAWKATGQLGLVASVLNVRANFSFAQQVIGMVVGIGFL